MKFFCLSLFSLVALITTSNAQIKYFIYLTDKGESQSKYFNKSDIEQALFQQYSIKAIERRKRNSNTETFNYSDYPIYPKYKETFESLGVKIINELPWFNAVSGYLDDKLMAQIRELPFVSKVEKVKSLVYRNEFTFKSSERNPYPNEIFSKGSLLDYGNSFTQLNLSKIPPVHERGITGKGVLIGLLDTGFRWREHEALQNVTVVAEKDFVFGDDTTANQAGDHPQQDNHGTAILSIVGGKKEGKLYGASYESNFILGKTEDIRSEKRVEEDNYAAAIHWMEKYGVDIISSSLGYSEFDDPRESYSYKDMNGETTIVARAVDSAFARGVVMVTAAGNEFNTPWKYIISPADAKYVIACGAVNSIGIIAGFSSRGPTSDGRIKPDVCAMGVSVFAAFPGSPTLYAEASGTSASTPIVAGVAGLLLSHYPEIDQYQVRDAIRLTASQSTNPDTVYGWGIASAVEALSFPQVVKRSIDYYLLKSVFNTDFDTTNLNFHYTLDGGITFDSVSMSYTGNNIKFELKLPPLPESDKIRFYFTYLTKSGSEKRVPPESGESFSFVLKDKKVFQPSKILNVVTSFYLYQNYPNPFNGTTRFKFDLLTKQQISLRIYDVLGREIKTLVNNANFSAGSHTSVTWDGKDDLGKTVPSGIYFYQLVSDRFVQSRKLVLLK
jgi:subtilisin family serine protease